MKALYQDPDLLIIDKPAGLADPASELVKEFPELLKVGGKDHGACHRLDVGTSGLLVFARNEETYQKMREAFSKNRVEKEYHAVVQGTVTKGGKIDWPIGPDPKSAKRVKIYKNLKEARRNRAQEAVTIYSPVDFGFVPVGPDSQQPFELRYERSQRADQLPPTRTIDKIDSETTLLQIIIKSGRRHQIRAHLAAIGHPLVGDLLYGRPATDRLYLHASR
ncbi:MAG: RNA pseudouridine synthase [Deltaproteobacteria bacterium]|nr:RNA pseudouridine synthase [Deltaproteobacteria bacterium]